jgi:hypothetical protein
VAVHNVLVLNSRFACVAWAGVSVQCLRRQGVRCIRMGVWYHSKPHSCLSIWRVRGPCLKKLQVATIHGRQGQLLLPQRLQCSHCPHSPWHLPYHGVPRPLMGEQQSMWSTIRQAGVCGSHDPMFFGPHSHCVFCKHMILQSAGWNLQARVGAWRCALVTHPSKATAVIHQALPWTAVLCCCIT